MKTLSLVIPVFRNAANIPDLLAALESIHREVSALEVVFVVDGSPDDSHLRLATALPSASFPAQLLALSRNFGTFAALKAGLSAGGGDCFGVMAADLQEPPELIVELYTQVASRQCDVAVGRRTARNDPFLSSLLARLYWVLYRRFVQPEVPPGGVDIFACSRQVRDHILELRESGNALIGLLLWVGFRRAVVPYVRRKRALGRSAWSLRKRLNYLADSVFGFSDLPIRLLFRMGLLGLAVSIVLAFITLGAKLSGNIPIPGYAATVLTVIFFGALNCLGLGIIGGYVWRTFENTKNRPGYIVAAHQSFPGAPSHPSAPVPS